MSWESQVGQARVASILHNSVKNNRVAHAYLFAGNQGVGKLKMAIQLAKTLLCVDSDGEACGKCHHCLRIDSGNHPDLRIVTPEGTSIKIDQIRELQKGFSFKAVESSLSVYIIQHVDRMTVQAANSLLKFLEEPSYPVTAILLTEHVHQILPTILSRCQVVHFDELPFESRVERLKSEGYYEPIARIACQITADLGQAREWCQSEWFAQYRNLVLQLTEDILDKGSYALVTIQEKILKNEQGNQGLPFILDLLVYWYRDLLYFQIDRKQELVNTDQLDAIQRQALRCSRPWILKGIDVVMETKSRIGRHTNPQLSLERMVIQLQEG
ncbi:DNA polymerase III subunit delta' [Ammoniphilus sp. YIM 78166]|uniref:DNA polymerase III subunit delta' n=1 Tax=Ammoniphilus sp. YIM 78166 TaxID=1644106 RepID=UPI00106F6C76|nr:DNA polymerase III subunit delta' [Ammoniphilus sp. YIM 78166]